MEPQSNQKQNIFHIISLVMGILAILSICTAIIPIPLGAAGILFAILSHRKGKPLDTMALVGVVTSIAGMATSFVLIAMSFLMLPAMLQDETYREQLDMISESLYDMSFDEIMEEGYGIDLDELLGTE